MADYCVPCCLCTPEGARDTVLGRLSIGTQGEVDIRETDGSKIDHMDSLSHMVYMFLCPQGDTVDTDNPKLRGVLMLSPRNIILVKRAHLGFTSIVSHKI
jgi:hypothetical protein